MAAWYRPRDGGVDLFVRLTPRSSRDELGPVESLSDGSSRLGARVRTVPEKGAANAALELLIARRLAVPRSAVRIIAGQTSRQKTVRVDATLETLLASLNALAAPAP
ncbi:MAG: DUF167 domain-containing protein [Rhizobiaceae bacterium]|nr:DUF167 domain-containing protein [Rhizobiaceae bacterium]